jgi:hypothetical protein
LAKIKEGLDRQQAHEKLLEDLEYVIGFYCELRSMDNVLACYGRLQALQGEAVVIVSNTGLDMPVTIFNTLYKIIIHRPGKAALVFCGQICGSTRSFWKMDRLEPFHFKESRAYFRQPVSGKGLAVCINDLFWPSGHEQVVAKAKLCRVLDISLEGIQVWQSEAGSKVGDWLLLTDVLLGSNNHRLHKFICQVCRVVADGRGGESLGCRFALMNEQEQDELCSDIFDLQRRDIQLGRRR